MALLAVLSVVVGVLQYRWVGEVSIAERERLRASVQTRAADLASAVDRDVTQAFAAFQIEQAAVDADAGAALRAAMTKAAEVSLTGTTVKAVFVATADSDTLERFDPERGRLDAVPWPSDLAALQPRLPRARGLGVPGLPLDPSFFPEAIGGAIPAFIVPMPHTTPLPAPVAGGTVVFREVTDSAPARSLLVWLDLPRVQSQLLAPLVQRTFGDASTSEFDVTVRARQSGTPLFSTSAIPLTAAGADFTRDLLSLRLDDLHWTATPQPPTGAPAMRSDRVAITIVRQGVGVRSGTGGPPTIRRDVAPGEWTMAIRAKRGSLDAIVERSRMRNLVTSLGVLVLLGASTGLLVGNARRTQRTARQQLEFVASVSHELRTPLAVIRSAGENLADGVVTGSQVANYGALIRDEGRRLSEMVDRVMELAGLSSGPRPSMRARPVRATVSVPHLVDAAVVALAQESAARGVRVDVVHANLVTTVSGDAGALMSAFQNVIGNAVKYSFDGGVVDVATAAMSEERVQVRVSDRGLGIDGDDLPHVCEPFFRGRRAVASQVRGSGLGLSVVQRSIRAHGGDVRVAARAGGGTEVVIDLPAAAAQQEPSV